ncbi:PAS domain-containing sensor histidine kinase [Paenibacillus herberti]|uniref:histidine kinase n=1 Tax=Paenibacillus herberti TaxID=1619309 RepID=A0A229NVH3_9BACL|nr:sensor histidine kinase [Paenibacillus herberti]OXM13840.1 histidine kinase [Paenibacillus herberti]
MDDPLFKEQLRESLKQLADVKFALDEASIVAVTDAAGRIQYVNDKFCEISGYSREELTGRTHRVVKSDYHRPEFFKELWRTISSGKVWKGEVRNRAKNGRLYWVDTTIVPFVNGEGQPYQYLAIRHEVTELKETQEQLQQAMAGMMQIQEEERRRFSRELHDGIGQSLFSFKISLDRILSESADPRLEGLLSEVFQLMEEVRGMAWELRPSVLDDLGIVPALRTYIQNFEKHYGIRVQFNYSLSGRPELAAETALYRIVQESLTNMGKYAGVSEVSVSLQENDGLLEAVIRDSGVGFELKQHSRGVGLLSMEERARAAGGRLEIESAPGDGTVVRLLLPLSRKDSSAP